MIRRCAYADVGIFSTYLTGYGKAPILAKEEQTLLKALASTSQRMDRYIGWRTFGPTVGTKYWDAYIRPQAQGGIGVEGPQGVGGWVGGSGGAGDITYANPLAGVTDVILARGSHWTEWIYPDGPNAGAELNMGTWLCGAPTAVTLTALDLSSAPIVLLEGYDQDYTLMPADGQNPSATADGQELPAERLRLTPKRAATLLGTPYRLAVTGSWGWADERDPLTTLAVPLAPTDTTMTVNAGDGILVWAGQTLWADEEQMYVRHVPVTGPASAPVNTDAGIVLQRGVNGTLPAAHLDDAQLSRMTYAEDAEWCCIEIARNRFRGRVMGALATFAEGRVMLAEKEEETLKRLDSFVKPREEGLDGLGVCLMNQPALHDLEPGDAAYLRDGKTRRCAVVEIVSVSECESMGQWIAVRPITALYRWDGGKTLPEPAAGWPVFVVKPNALEEIRS